MPKEVWRSGGLGWPWEVVKDFFITFFLNGVIEKFSNIDLPHNVWIAAVVEKCGGGIKSATQGFDFRQAAPFFKSRSLEREH